MATYTTTVDPNGGADYASINAYVGGEDTLYSSGDIAVADCRRSGATKDTTAVNVTGFTAGVIPKIIVNSAYRHQGEVADRRDGGTGNYIAGLYVADDTTAIFVSQALFECYYFVIPTVSSGSYMYCVRFDPGSGVSTCNYVLSGNLFTAANSRNYGISFGSSGGGSALVINNILYGSSIGATRYAIGVVDADYTAINIYNNIIYSFGYGIQGLANTVGVNNIALSCSTCYYGSFNAASDYNVSSDATAPGTNTAESQTSYTDYFVDPSNGDFHLKASSYDLWGINSENLTATFTTDIDGDTRPNSNQFGIGADYYVAAAGGTMIDATLGTVSISGFDPAVSIGTSILATEGAVVIAGENASVLQGISIAPSSGAIVVSGFDAGISVGTSISSGAGAVVVQGYDASVSTGISFQSTAGAVAVIGYNADVSQGLSVAATAGALTVSGFGAGISTGISLTAGPGAVAIAGYQASITNGLSISSTMGALTIAGYQADISAGTSIEASPGAVVVSGFDAEVVNGLIISATLGQVQVQGYQATISAGTSIESTAGAVVITGYAATVAQTQIIEATLGLLAVAGYDAGIVAGVSVDCQVGSIVITGYNCGITTSELTEINALPGAILISGFDAGIYLTPDGRINIIENESRTNIIAFENRTNSIDFEDRTNTIS